MIKGLRSNGDTGTIHIVLTNFCNLGCKGCYQPEEDRLNQNQSGDNDILNENILIEIEKLFNMFSDQNKDVTLTFFGGEPLYRQRNIIKILNWLHSKKLEPNQITIPTSGGKNQGLIYNIEPVIELVTLKFPETKLCISQSYDGIKNEELRNISNELIMESSKFVERLAFHHTGNYEAFKPNYNSILIPQIIDENYFIDNFRDVISVTQLIPSFRIPYVLDHDSNLDSGIFGKAIEKFLNEITFKDFIRKHSRGYRSRLLIHLHKEKKLPKLISDVIGLIIQPSRYENEFNWCQAGKSHFAITTKGLHPNGCEYLHKPALELHSKQMEYCNKCEIKQWCNKPCLKTIEISEEQFLRHCTIRKILLIEIRKVLVCQEP